MLIDTLRYARQLQAAGVSAEHAEAQAEALRDALQVGLDNLSTKTDLDGLRSEVKTEIAALRGEVKTEMMALRGEVKTEIAALRGEVKTEIAAMRGEVTLVKWMLGLLLAGVVSLVIKTFFA